MKTGFLVWIVILFSLAGRSQNNVHIIADRYKEFLFRMGKPDTLLVKAWSNSLDAEEHWPDLDYTDASPSKWDVLIHLGRVQHMSVAITAPSSPMYNDMHVEKTLMRALDLWLEKRFSNANWWHNEIGIPQVMRDIVILLEDRLTADQKAKALEVMGQYRLKGGGANLVWSADIGLHLGAVTGNDSLVRVCSRKISDEIKIDTSDGIQPDYSFHQHGARLMQFAYGTSFIRENIRIGWQLHGTPWAFPESKTEIMAAYILNGSQWMSRGINTVPGTMDRSVSRVDNLHNPDLRSLIPYLCELIPKYAGEFKMLEARQNENAPMPTGFRSFPYSDFSVHHRNKFSFFLKTVSARTLLTESINNENLKGRLLHSGDAYLVRNGSEYFNIMPVWDWELLPGMTYATGAGDTNPMSFVGAATDSINGITTMDICFRKNDTGLVAKKIWACNGDLVVSLIAGLTSPGTAGEVKTALDQSRLQGQVTVNKPGNVLKNGSHSLNKVRWIHHNSFAYIPLEAASVTIKTGAVTGSWRSINKGENAGMVNDNIFFPVMLHGTGITNKSTGYVLAYCETPAKAAALARVPTWKVLHNDTLIQAVGFADGSMMAAFYSRGSISSLSVDRPCLVMVAAGKMVASDPSHKGGTVSIRRGDKVYNLLLPADGTSVSVVL